MTNAPIELYYWPTPNGWKITIMLEELGVPYVVKYVNIGKGEQFEPDFLKIAPNNRMPAIVDPDDHILIDDDPTNNFAVAPGHATEGAPRTLERAMFWAETLLGGLAP